MTRLLDQIARRSPTEEELKLLEGWTTVGRMASRTEETPTVVRALLDRWVRAGIVEEHDNGFTAAKFRVRSHR